MNKDDLHLNTVTINMVGGIISTPCSLCDSWTTRVQNYAGGGI